MLSFKNLGLAYVAGTVGGMANFLFGALLTQVGILTALGVHLPPPQLPAALYQRLVWGGVWGAALFFPLPKNFWLRSFLLGVGPSLVGGLVFFPQRLGKGPFAIELSPWMPMVIFVFNWVWGMGTLASGKSLGVAR